QDNTRFYYVSDASSKSPQIRVKTQGAPGSPWTDALVYSGVTGIMQSIRVSPVNEQLLVDVKDSGILSVNLVTHNSGWIATESNKGLVFMNGPFFSPDGSLVAFGANRVVKGKPLYGFYRVGFTGGTIYTVTETPLQGDPKFTANWPW